MFYFDCFIQAAAEDSFSTGGETGATIGNMIPKSRVLPNRFAGGPLFTGI